jgi:hypothetical protein
LAFISVLRRLAPALGAIRVHVAESAEVGHVGDVSDGGMLGVGVAEGNLVVRGLGLALDPSRPAAAAFVSHAHAAGPACSEPVLASRETAALARASGWRTLGWGEVIEVPLDGGQGGGSARLSLAPAGHLLGAAQLVVDHARGRLVYAGDWCGHPDPTLAAGAVVACDELIVGHRSVCPSSASTRGSRRWGHWWNGASGASRLSLFGDDDER